VKEIEDVVACVVDRGTFFPVADRLAREMKQVYYCSPSGDGFETAGKDSLGYGHPGVEAIRCFWPIKSEIDVFVFPDCRDWDLQLELESQGFPVWGSKRAEDLESLRGLWLDVAGKVGLPMPNTEVVHGLEHLRRHLFEHRDEKKYVKISRYRGDMETWCAEDWVATRNKLDTLAHKWGGLQNLLTFYVQDDLETDIEGGADTYFVDGFPDEVIIGYEKKNMGYFGAVMPRKEMPPEIWQPCELLGPVLRQFEYCNFFSTEVRVVQDESYLLDPCCRCPSPAGEEQLEMLGNFAEIVWHGAHGELMQPKWMGKYCGEIVIQWNGDKDGPKSLRVPEGVRQWVKLYACAYAEEAYHFPASQDPEALGCVVGIGDTPDEVLEHLKRVREELSGQPVELRMDPLADLIVEIKQAKAEGLGFGEGKELPEPSAVLDNAG
jgi:hypothetical protein